MSWKYSCKKLPRNVMDWEQPLHFKWQTNAWASSKAMRGRGNEELSSYLSQTLLPCLVLLATRTWLLSDTVQLARRLLWFSFLWEIVALSSQWLTQFQAYPYTQKHLLSIDISFGSPHLSKSGQNCSNSRL